MDMKRDEAALKRYQAKSAGNQVCVLKGGGPNLYQVKSAIFSFCVGQGSKNQSAQNVLKHILLLEFLKSDQIVKTGNFLQVAPLLRRRN